MSNTTVAIVVPFHRSSVNEDERISLRQLFKHLAPYDKYLVIPEGLRPDFSESFKIKTFPEKYFSSYLAHNWNFRISREFHEAFLDYDYILTYELDSLVFSDQLLDWCQKGYDYIGAPWLAQQHPWLRGDAVGNGGLSLKHIRHSLRVINKRQSFFASLRHIKEALGRNFRTWFYERYYAGKYKFDAAMKRKLEDELAQDVFWGMQAKSWDPDFKVAPVHEALRFSFEMMPEECLKRTKGQLPFGCHGWTKHREFWQTRLDL